MFLHRLSWDSELAAFLRWVRLMITSVFTISEKEGSANDDMPCLVAAAMEFYSVVLDALEATLQPSGCCWSSRSLLVATSAMLGSGGGIRCFKTWVATARGARL
jgi:hypothetical protein